MSPPQHNLTHTLQYNAYNFVAVLWYSYGIELIAILSTSSQALCLCSPASARASGLGQRSEPISFRCLLCRGGEFKKSKG